MDFTFTPTYSTVTNKISYKVGYTPSSSLHRCYNLYYVLLGVIYKGVGACVIYWLHGSLPYSAEFRLFALSHLHSSNVLLNF